MRKKKPNQYSQADVDAMRNQLAGLPDVTSERLQKKHVLDSLKFDINTLINEKGYTVNEVHEHLTKFGLTDVTLKDIKDLSAGRSPRKRRTTPAHQSVNGNASDNGGVVSPSSGQD